MRITNQIMQRNALTNINLNKVNQDNLTTQMSTQKKISRPSDDPVVAIRALRLRSNVTEITQYYSKNIPDANSWMEVTEDALDSLSKVLTNMISQCTKGSNGDLTTSDRQIILDQLEALSSEVYATGDADYAGRYVFTGYRTDTSLSFQKKTTKPYTITEQIDRSAISSINHVNTGKISQWTSSNFNTAGIQSIQEADVSSAEVSRIVISYKDVDGTVPSIEYTDDAGTVQTITADAVVNSTDTTTYAPDPYTYVSKNPDAVIMLKDTGELLLGENVIAKLMATKDDPTTGAVDESEIRITYQKSEWNSNDLRPEHYFYCKSEDENGNPIEYNADYLDGTKERQAIEYDVGFNQKIRVNSTADECFKLGIGRTVDDITAALRQVIDLENTQDSIKKKLESVSSDADRKTLNQQLSAVEKALTYAKDVCQKSYESGITSLQEYLDATSISITAVGTRSSKLELIESRTQNQKTTFETLRSNNEDIDITEVAIELSSAEVTYNAALVATGKIAQNTLLNYI